MALPTTAARADPLEELAAIGGWVDSAGKAPSGKQQILNEDSGEYADRDQDESWQGTWKSRLDKASGMSPDEILMAARGGGNTEQKEGPESPASAKRRAMAGCRIEGIRKKAGMPDEKACAARVLKGDPDFMLDVLDAGKPQRSAQAEPAPVALPADPARETAPAPRPRLSRVKRAQQRRCQQQRPRPPRSSCSHNRAGDCKKLERAFAICPWKKNPGSLSITSISIPPFFFTHAFRLKIFKRC